MLISRVAAGMSVCVDEKFIPISQKASDKERPEKKTDNSN